MTNVDILARIKFLQSEAVERLPSPRELEDQVDVTLGHLRSIAHSNIMDFFVFDRNGMPKLDLARATRAQTAGIAKVKIKQLEPIMTVLDGEVVEREVTQIELSLWDKNKALENMMKHLGLLKEKPVEINIAFIDRMLLVVKKELEARGVDAEAILRDLQGTAPSSGVIAGIKQ